MENPMRYGFAVLLLASLQGCFKKVETIGYEDPDRYEAEEQDSASKSPSCKIESQPSGWLRSRDLEMEFSCLPPKADPDDLIEAYLCRLSTSSWVECSESTRHFFVGMADGSTSMQVRARTRKGLQSPVVSKSVKVDATPPSLETFRFDGLITNVPTFAVRALDEDSGVDRLLCRVSYGSTVGSWYECGGSSTRTLTLRNLVMDRDYHLDVKVGDRAGNESGESRQSFRTTFVAPSELCTIAPISSPTRLRTANLSFVCASAQPIQRRECQIDSAPWGACTGTKSHSVNGLSEGSHTFRVRFVNDVGLASPEAQRSWMVDVTPPIVSITSAVTVGLSGDFSYDVSESNGIAREECGVALTGRTPVYASCARNWSVDDLEPGKNYTFWAKVTDVAGNVGTGSHAWDTVPPTGLPSCDIATSFPNGYSTSVDSTIAFSCASPHGPVSFPECRVGTAAWGACSSAASHVVRNLVDDQDARLCVRTKDLWNRSSGDLTCINWHVSLRAPVMNPLSIDVAHPYARLFFSAGTSSCPLSGYECKLTGPTAAHDWRSCESPLIYSGLALNADYNFAARALTLCGQVSNQVSLEWEARAAHNGPVCRLVPASADDDVWEWLAGNRRQANVVCDAAPPVLSYECSDDGLAWAACTSPVNIDATVTGVVRKYVRGVDDLGARGPVSESLWNFDLSDPTVAINQLVWDGDTVRMLFSADDVGSGLAQTQCKIDGIFDWSTCTSPKSYTDSRLRVPGGTFTFRVRATDRSGRLSAEATYNWTNGNWSAWNACVASAPTVGSQTRTCTNPAPAGGGRACAGATSQSCTPPTCTNGASDYPACSSCPTGQGMVSGVCRPNAVNGGWGDWGACASTCGSGNYKTRTCAQPSPAYAGSTCTSASIPQATTTGCYQGACCLPAGTYLGLGDVPGYSVSEVTCHSAATPGAVVVNDSTLGCCSNQVRYSNPTVKTAITCGPGTNCSWCTPYLPGLTPPNYNWDNWQVHCN
jgi:hypothetical protein